MYYTNVTYLKRKSDMNAKLILVIVGVLALMGAAVFVITSAGGAGYTPSPESGAPVAKNDKPVPAGNFEPDVIYRSSDRDDDGKTVKSEKNQHGKNDGKEKGPREIEETKDGFNPAEQAVKIEGADERENRLRMANKRSEQLVSYIGPQCGLDKYAMEEVNKLVADRNQQLDDLRHDIKDKKRLAEEETAVNRDFFESLESYMDDRQIDKFKRLFSHRDPMKTRPSAGTRKPRIKKPRRPGAWSKRKKK